MFLKTLSSSSRNWDTWIVQKIKGSGHIPHSLWMTFVRIHSYWGRLSRIIFIHHNKSWNMIIPVLNCFSYESTELPGFIVGVQVYRGIISGSTLKLVAVFLHVMSYLVIFLVLMSCMWTYTSSHQLIFLNKLLKVTRTALSYLKFVPGKP